MQRVYRLLYDNIDDLRLHLMETWSETSMTIRLFSGCCSGEMADSFLIYRKNIPQGFVK